MAGKTLTPFCLHVQTFRLKLALTTPLSSYRRFDPMVCGAGMMDGTFENLVLERRATVTVCQNS
ncbi:MAG: hypothetical protein ACYTBP_03135 [Planctomycetota bacterium]|jgi:hypothetical protein